MHQSTDFPPLCFLLRQERPRMTLSVRNTMITPRSKAPTPNSAISQGSSNWTRQYDINPFNCLAIEPDPIHNLASQGSLPAMDQANVLICGDDLFGPGVNSADCRGGFDFTSKARFFRCGLPTESLIENSPLRREHTSHPTSGFVPVACTDSGSAASSP